MPAPSPTTKPSRSLSQGRQAWVGIVVAGGERLHGRESADAHGGDGGLGAAGDHGVRVAALDDAEGIADGVRGRGAGGGGGLVGAARAVADGDVSGGEVDDGAGDEERRDLARATGEHGRVFALDDVEAADAGADVDADAVVIGVMILRPEWSMASCAAAMAKWIKRPIFRASFLSMKRRGSKSFTSAANRTGWPVRSNALISAIPLRPASRPSQTSGRCCLLRRSGPGQ